MVSAITIDNIEHFAIGSSFLGTGGGGDPYLGSLLCREAIAEYGPVPVISVDELKDEDNIFIAAAMGAPTVMIEKLFSIEDQHRAVATLERFPIPRCADCLSLTATEWGAPFPHSR